MITENLSTLKIHKLTQEQYDRELESGNIDENALYLTPDEEVNLSEYATAVYVDELINGVGESLDGELEKCEKVAYKSTEIYDDTSGYASYPTTKAVYDYGENIKSEIQNDLASCLTRCYSEIVVGSLPTGTTNVTHTIPKTWDEGSIPSNAIPIVRSVSYEDDTGAIVGAADVIYTVMDDNSTGEIRIRTQRPTGVAASTVVNYALKIDVIV